MPNEVLISRRKLYDQVWKVPMRLLAPRYGLSDVGLAKICKKHNIPRPGLGYWAQVQHGVAIGPDALPDPATNPEILLKAHQPPLDKKSDAHEFTSLFGRALAAEADWPEIKVHPDQELRAETAQKMERLLAPKVDSYGRTIPSPPTTLDVCATPKTLRRAHLVLDVLLGQLEKRGAEVRSVGIGESGTFVRYCGECIGLRVTEQVKVVQRDSSGKAARLGYYECPPFPPWQFKQSTEPSGRLTVGLDTTLYIRRTGLRRTWRDTEHQRVEECLNDIIVGLVRIAEAQRREKSDDVEYEAQRKDDEECERITSDQARRESDRLAKLQAEVDQWSEAESIRRYVEAARRGIERLPVGTKRKAAAWLNWIGGHANKIDPLSSANLPSIGMDVSEAPTPFYTRPALQSEYPAIQELIKKTCVASGRSGEREAELVVALQTCGSCAPELSLVAIQNESIVGYVMLSDIGIRGRPGQCGAAIGPVCVDPEHWRKGIAKEIMDSGMVAAMELGRTFFWALGPLPPKLCAFLELGPVTESVVKTPFHDTNGLIWNLGDVFSPGDTFDFPVPWLKYFGREV